MPRASRSQKPARPTQSQREEDDDDEQTQNGDLEEMDVDEADDVSREAFLSTLSGVL